MKKEFYNQFFLVWALSTLGNFFLIFLWINVHDFPLIASLISFFAISLFSGLLSFFGLKMSIQAKLPSLKIVKLKALLPGIYGALVAISLIFLSNKLFLNIPQEDVTFINCAPATAKLIFAIFSSLNEEIFYRLFLLSSIYLFLQKFFQRKDLISWISISLVTLIAITFNYFLTFEITFYRLLILNIIGAITFGYLYVYKNFWCAILAHFLVEFFMNGF